MATRKRKKKNALPPSSPKRTKAEVDPTILPKVLAVLGVGAGRKAASAQAGIRSETLRQYESIGEKAWTKREAAILEEREIDLSDRETLFADFYQELREAETGVEVYLLGQMNKAAKKDWKAADKLLEKLYPKKYGRHIDINARVSGDFTTTVDLSKLSADDLWKLKEIREKAAVEEE